MALQDARLAKPVAGRLDGRSDVCGPAKAKGDPLLHPGEDLFGRHRLYGQRPKYPCIPTRHPHILPERDRPAQLTISAYPAPDP
jgi:hypothetical protein